MEAEEEKPIQQVLSVPILLADRTAKSAREAESFVPENRDLARQVEDISELLRDAARLITTSANVYDRPIRRVSLDLTKKLDRALALARKCRRQKSIVLRHVLSINTATDFKRISSLLDSSLVDIRWILSTFDKDNFSINPSLPPISNSDPNLAWVWFNIAAVHMGRAEAADQLAIFAGDNDRKRMVLVDEKGVPPLVKMLKESGSVDAQSAAASALCNLANDHGRVRAIVESLGVQVVAKVLPEASMRVQILLVNLVSRMLEMDVNVKEEFGKENVMRVLVSLLGMDVDLKEFKDVNHRKVLNSLDSVDLITNEMLKNECFEVSKHHKAESPEDKLRLKVSCANALCKLAKRSSLNSRKITETKALLVLAKNIETEEAELKMSCLMVILELAAVAESNTDLKRAAFKPTSTAAKVVLDQLVKVMNEETNVTIVNLAIKAIGCLSSIFSAKEKRIVQSLVTHLGNRNPSVASEAAKALGKFVRDENYNRKEHSQAIIEFDGVQNLMSFLTIKRRGALHLHDLVLLCNLVIHAGNSKAFEQTKALSILEASARHVANLNSEFRDLFTAAVHHLTIYQAGAHTQAYGSVS